MKPCRICVVGNGRAGQAFAGALQRSEYVLVGPIGRGEMIPFADIVLLCVPERELPNVAALVPEGALVGHCSASTQLDVLAPHEAFSIHPLMTLAPHVSLAGAACAIDGTTAHALAAARELAEKLRMSPMQIAPDKRALYHAAASIASNFLVTLEDAAERAANACNVPRSALVPLVEAAVRAWSVEGFRGAITGPIARHDQVTVDRQRDAVERELPDLLSLFDEMTRATRRAMERTSA
jgi:predicted short-subunit dehydrogenase-like oxidoreductase (DUF2520 family)